MQIHRDLCIGCAGYRRNIRGVSLILKLVLELDSAADSVEFRPIATNPDHTKVATVCFNKKPHCLLSGSNEWRYKISGADGSTAARIDPIKGKLLRQPTITIHSHFKGLTILQSVEDSVNHRIEYISNSYLSVYNI